MANQISQILPLASRKYYMVASCKLISLRIPPEVVKVEEIYTQYLDYQHQQQPLEFGFVALNITNILKDGKRGYNGVYMSPFNLLRLFGVITPVSCEGEDYICNCSGRCEPNSAQVSGNTPKKSEPKLPEQSNSYNNSQQSSSNNNTCSNCSRSTSNNNASNGGDQKASSPTISNRPCYSASNASCASDIDIDSLSAELGGVKQIDWVVESDLSHCHLIRQASQVAVDSVTRILTEAVSAYEDYHVEYRRLMNTMMDTLEDSRKACGADLEVIDCKIILLRAKLDEMKLRIQELDMFLGTLDKLGSASAETAFIAHAEYASIALSERMHSVAQEVKRLQEETREKERDMMEVQSLIIVETGKSLK